MDKEPFSRSAIKRQIESPKTRTGFVIIQLLKAIEYRSLFFKGNTGPRIRNGYAYLFPIRRKLER